MIAALKSLQLVTALGVLVLFWLIYPGAALVMASAVGLCYLLLALGALLDFRPAVWLAFLFSILTVLFSGYGVYRYLVNGFDFLAGRFPNQQGFYVVPYVFGSVMVASAFVVAMHLLGWRWLIGGRRSPR